MIPVPEPNQDQREAKDQPWVLHDYSNNENVKDTGT